MSLYDGDTFEYRGRTFKAELRPDDDSQTPWDDDGHGEVSDWTSREKTSGERVLIADRGSKRLYNFAGAVRTARKDDWGCKHSKIVDGVFVSGHATKGELAACAQQRHADGEVAPLPVAPTANPVIVAFRRWMKMKTTIETEHTEILGRR